MITWFWKYFYNSVKQTQFATISSKLYTYSVKFTWLSIEQDSFDGKLRVFILIHFFFLPKQTHIAKSQKSWYKVKLSALQKSIQREFPDQLWYTINWMSY